MKTEDFYNELDFLKNEVRMLKEIEDLTNSVLEGVDLTNLNELLNITPKVLKLTEEDQMKFIEGILDLNYTLCEDDLISRNVEKFLTQKAFNDIREKIALKIYMEGKNDDSINFFEPDSDNFDDYLEAEFPEILNELKKLENDHEEYIKKIKNLK